MIINYETDLSKQTFLESEGMLAELGVLDATSSPSSLRELGAVDNPILAFDSNKLRQLDNGELIQSMFGHPKVNVISQYDGTSNGWFKTEGTWPASIDTLVHLSGQRNATSFEQVESVLDVACGTGIAGVYAANKNQNVKKVHFSDIAPGALMAIERNQERITSESVNVLSFLSDGLEHIYDKYDIILASAIPATPAYEGLQRPLEVLFQSLNLHYQKVFSYITYLLEELPSL